MITTSSWPSNWCLPVLDDLEFDALLDILEAADQLPTIEYDDDGQPLPFVVPDSE